MVTRIGLDLGYANITISDADGEVYREPAVALIDKNTRRIISVGNAALEMSDSVSEETLLVRPFKNGLLFDRQITQSIIANAIKALPKDDRICCVVGVPSDLLPKQEKEIHSMLAESGVTDVFSVNRAAAALIGAGRSPLENIISVNVGAFSTEIVVFHDGDITYSTKANVGGEDFDKAVKQYIFEQGEVNVSLSVARAIKEKLGAVWHGREEETVEIEGTLSLTGNKVRLTISSEDIVGVFEKPLHKLFIAIAEAVKKIPLDQIESTFKNGIVLTGGGSMIYGTDIMMSKVLGITVNRPEYADDAVAIGLSKISRMVSCKGRGVKKNITSELAKYYENK